MLHFTDRNKAIYQQARNRKASELRIGRKYLVVARRLELSEKSATVQFWMQHL